MQCCKYDFKRKEKLDKMGFIKNTIGDLLGYGKCPITNDTYWHTDLASVPYSGKSGVLVSARALSELPEGEIAQKVFQRSQGFHILGRRYSVEEIAEQIPQGCMPMPRK